MSCKAGGGHAHGGTTRATIHGRDHPAIRGKVSGPLFDRIDLDVEVRAVLIRNCAETIRESGRPRRASVRRRCGQSSNVRIL